MDEASKADVKAAVHEALNEHTGITLEQHSDHHRFIGQWIEREAQRQQTRERIKQHVIGWGVVSAIGGVGYAIWEAIKKVVD